MNGLNPQMEGEENVSEAALSLLRVSGVTSSRFLMGWMDMDARACVGKREESGDIKMLES